MADRHQTEDYPSYMGAFKENRHKNKKQPYRLYDYWVSLEDVAEVAGCGRTTAFRLMKYCGKSPKQVVEYWRNR